MRSGELVALLLIGHTLRSLLVGITSGDEVPGPDRADHAAAAGFGSAVANADDIALSWFARRAAPTPSQRARRIISPEPPPCRRPAPDSCTISKSSRRSMLRRGRTGAHLPADTTNRRPADGNRDRLRDDFKADRARTPRTRPCFSFRRPTSPTQAHWHSGFVADQTRHVRHRLSSDKRVTVGEAGPGCRFAHPATLTCASSGHSTLLSATSFW